ncbi:hypothetical protein ElyMa_003790800 [Elysia marginata]|uniref:Uncharacterized protein n=1 Tax=Elysia marginata TaxID=1093978 RepID=A0AAV4FCL7_9GAST|nr:hypothetical protein ElyMa_003790800 [Elysia marginata]
MSKPITTYNKLTAYASTERKTIARGLVVVVVVVVVGGVVAVVVGGVVAVVVEVIVVVEVVVVVVAVVVVVVVVPPSLSLIHARGSSVAKVQEWVCVVCNKRRQLMMTTGLWYHGYHGFQADDDLPLTRSLGQGATTLMEKVSVSSQSFFLFNGDRFSLP